MSKLFLGTEEITPTDTKLITTYTGGNGIIVAKDTINIDQSVVALKAELPKNVSQLTNDKGYLTNADLTEKFDNKQDKLTAGDNITISEDNVISAVDTTYTAGEGIAIQDGVISNTRDSASWGNISGDITAQTDLKTALDAKQGTLTAGANITIENGVISASGTGGGGAEYTAGTGLKLTGNVFSIDDTVATVESVNTSIAGKQDVINDIDTIRSNATAGKEAKDTLTNIVPEQASTTNKLADKNYVNSSVATNTAYFKGTFDTLEELKAVTEVTNNDYGFVKGVDDSGNPVFNRYKFNGTEWIYEYSLNNSSFTAAQWDAVNSGVTAGKVTGYDAHVANEGIHVTAEQKTSWTAKQDAIEDLATIRSGAALGATALQSYTESDPTVPAHVKAITEENITAWNNKSSFSGSYEDLTNKPTIPTVNNNTIIIKQGDEIKGTFTLNQGEDYTVELDVGGSGTTAASQFGEINGTTTTSTTELDLGRTVKKSQMVGLNVGNTLVLPELYSLSTDGTKIILQNAIGANVMWSVVYVKALNVAELQEATSETSGVVKIDSTPTAGSTNAITSGAVYAALQEIKNTLSQLNSGN